VQKYTWSREEQRSVMDYGQQETFLLSNRDKSSSPLQPNLTSHHITSLRINTKNTLLLDRFKYTNSTYKTQKNML